MLSGVPYTKFSLYILFFGCIYAIKRRKKSADYVKFCMLFYHSYRCEAGQGHGVTQTEVIYHFKLTNKNIHVCHSLQVLWSSEDI